MSFAFSHPNKFHSFLVAFAALLAIHSSTRAAEVTLEWDPAPNAAGYRVYYGTAPGSYTQSNDAGASTTLTVTGLEQGKTYFFAARAYTESGVESPPSNEVSYTASSPSLLTQRILFPSLPDVTLGDPPLLLKATGGDSGQPVVFQVVSGPAEIDDSGRLRVTGTGTVTVRATQAGDATHLPAEDVERSFTVHPLTPEAWRARHFTAAELADPSLEATLWGMDANPDGDARSNAWEYALGSDPRSFDAEPVLALNLESGATESSRFATFAFTRQNHANAELIVEVSGATGEFVPLNKEPETVLPAESSTRLFLTDDTPVSPENPRRARLRLQLPNENAPRFSEIQATIAFTVTPATQSKGVITAKNTFAGAPLAEPLLASGRVAATGTGALIPEGTAWPKTLLSDNGPCYLVLTDGPNAGITADLVGLDNGVLLLSDDLQSIALPGDRFEVRRHHTLGGLFEKAGSGQLQASANPLTADSVDFIRPDGGADTFHLASAENLWLDGNGQPANARVILPEEGFIITRRATAPLTLFQQGVISGNGGAHPLIVPVESGVNLLCLPFISEPLTLDELGLYTGNSATGVAGGARYTETDTVRVPEPGGSITVHYYSTNRHTTGNLTGDWYTSKLKASGGTVFKPGTAFYIHRTGPAFPWRVPSR